ncbi:MAG TPA: hypothetical protein ENN73_04860 [Firmicutes bacterium]|nr:hypothetical protein [Bacillota bacterium]
MTNFLNDHSAELIGTSPFVYFLRYALRNFGIHINDDFLICLSNLCFNLNYSSDKDADYWMVEFMPDDILQFLSVTTGITLMNNNLPRLSSFPAKFDSPTLLYGKWDGIRTPVWGYAKEFIGEESISGETMDYDGTIKTATISDFEQVICPELSSFQISYNDIVKAIAKNAMKYLGFSGPVFSSGYMYGIEFFQIWMEDLDAMNKNIQPDNTARFCSIIANNAKAAGRYFTESPHPKLKGLGNLLENLSELLSPFGKSDDIKFILETKEQLNFLIEAITRAKEIYLYFQSELEDILK